MAPPTCSEPLWQMLLTDTFNWMGCGAALHAGGFLTVGLMFYFTVAAIMLNWSESLVMPAAWTAVFAGVFIPFLPATVATRVTAGVALFVASSILYLWHAWKR